VPYLNLDLDYFEHRKTVRLVGLLGRGAEVLPIKLWRYCGKYHAEDGKLVGYSPEEIEAQVGWWGKPGEAVAAFCDERVQYLQEITGGFEVVGWLDHQGHLKAFKERARNAANARWGNATGTAPSMPQALDKQCPVPTKPNQPKLPARAREANSSQLPMSAGAPEPIRDPNDYRQSFDQFWAIFPRKAGRGACWNIWDRMTKAERAKALEMAEAYADLFNRADEPRRSKLWSAVTWLRDRHWEDDVKEWLLQAEVKL
jgi:hypothetical protein